MRLLRFFAFILCLCPLAAYAQTAEVDGAVHDPSGAVISKASVEFRNQDTGIRLRATTNANGIYRITTLNAGKYDATVQASGFKTLTRENIVFEVAQTSTVNFTLQVGAESQSITVNSDTPLLNTTTNAIGGLVTPQKVESMPLVGRNSAALMVLVPGVRVTSSTTDEPAFQSHYQFFSINGSRPDQGQFLLDGGNDTDITFNGPEYSPQVEEIKEYRIQTSNFSAEYGNASGGVVNIVTKGGANQVHASLFEYLRNDVLAANDFFSNRAGTPRQPLRYNQFGGTVGGPIVKNRTFFFFAYEGTREVVSVPTTTTVPTALQKTGDFSQTFNSAGNLITIYDPLTTVPDPNNPGQYIRSAFPGNVIPQSRIDSVAAKVATYYPSPNQPGLPNSGLDNYFSNYTTDRYADNFSGRVDHQLNSRTALTARFSRTNIDKYSVTPPTFGYNDIAGYNYYPQPQHHVYALGKATETFSPTFIGDFSVSWARWFYNEYSLSKGFDTTELGFPSAIAENAGTTGFPFFSISGMSSLGAAPNVEAVSDRYELRANLWKEFNKHTLKFGGVWGLGYFHETRHDTSSYSFSTAFTQGPNPSVSSTSAGLGFASFLLGTMASGSTPTGADAAEYYKAPYYGVYVQDEYRLTQRLTLNAGLRWEYESPRTEALNRVSNFDFTDSATLSNGTKVQGGLLFPGVGGTPRGSWNANTTDFAPRFGFAYNLSDKMVFRGGYGIFYSNSWGNGPNDDATPQTGFFCSTAATTSLNGGFTPYAFLSNPFPQGFCAPTGSSAGLLTELGTQVYILNRHAPQPYNQTWNLDIQRTLPWNTIAEVAYSGSRGIHLPGLQEYNQLAPGYLALGSKLNTLVPNPYYGVIQQGTLSGSTITLGQSLRPYPHYLGVTSTNENYGNAIYHALQVRVDHRLTHGLNITGAYTLSKEIDDTIPSLEGFPGEAAGGGNPDSGSEFAAGTLQNYYNHRAERALVSWDTPQSLVLSFTYELPFGPGKPILDRHNALGAVVGGWQFNGLTTFQRGMPLQVSGGNTNGSLAGLGRPNWNGKNPTLGGAWENRLTSAFNTSDFSYNALYTFGTTPRLMPDLRAQGIENFNLSMFKTDNIGEKLKLQFRAEFFNAFNHVQFGAPNTSFGSSAFGAITVQQNAPRQIQLALRLIY